MKHFANGTWSFSSGPEFRIRLPGHLESPSLLRASPQVNSSRGFQLRRLIGRVRTFCRDAMRSMFMRSRHADLPSSTKLWSHRFLRIMPLAPAFVSTASQRRRPQLPQPLGRRQPRALPGFFSRYLSPSPVSRVY